MRKSILFTVLVALALNFMSCNSFNAADYNNDIIDGSLKIEQLTELSSPTSVEAYAEASKQAIAYAEEGIKYCEEHPDFNGDSSLSDIAKEVYRVQKEFYENESVIKVALSNITGKEDAVTNEDIDTYNNLIEEYTDLSNQFNSAQQTFATTNNVELR